MACSIVIGDVRDDSLAAEALSLKLGPSARRRSPASEPFRSSFKPGSEQRKRCISTTPVDLMGRLSNPPERLKQLVDRGAGKSRHGPKRPSRRPEAIAAVAAPTSPKEAGQLSNPGRRPVQRRLPRSDVDELAAGYKGGLSLRALAEALGVHHRTVAAHLDQLGVPRRVNPCKMNPHEILQASRRYEAGDSLETVAAVYGVDATTVRRELHRAHIAIRPRRGWR